MFCLFETATTGKSEVRGQPLWNVFIQLKDDQVKQSKEKQKGTLRTRRVLTAAGAVKGESERRQLQS